MACLVPQVTNNDVCSDFKNISSFVKLYLSCYSKPGGTFYSKRFTTTPMLINVVDADSSSSENYNVVTMSAPDNKNMLTITELTFVSKVLAANNNKVDVSYSQILSSVQVSLPLDP